MIQNMHDSIERSDYCHEKDGQLMKIIMENEAVDALLEFLRKNHVEDIYKQFYYASCIEVTERNASGLFTLLEQACTLFHHPNVPRLLLSREYDMSIEIMGFAEPFLMISERYLNGLEEKALLGAFASRIAGIRTGHNKPLFFQWLLDNLKGYIPKAVRIGLDAVVNNWSRCRYLTYDRAFYLATGDEKLALQQIFYPICDMKALERFRLNEDENEYEVQLGRFYGDDAVKSGAKLYHSLTSDEVWLPERYVELLKYIRGEG